MNLRAGRTLAVAAVAMALASGPATAIGHLADIRVVDRVENRELPIHWHEGKAYVVGKPGNEYQIGVRNRAGGDLLAVISVDGVNVVTGETASPDQTGYVFNRGGGYDIRGWRKSLTRTAAFYFTTLPDAYASRTGRPDNVGVIGVALFRRKPEPQPIPGAAVGRGDGFAGPTAEAIRDRAATASENRKQPSTAESVGETGEPRVPQSLASTPLSTPLGTGHGRSENSPARNVTFERATSQAEEVITLYYESHANLLARGIVVAPPVVRPVPRPFPGHFVPDPPRG